MKWSPQQDGALKRAAQWLADPHGDQVFRIFGFAGTGKTTLAKQIAQGVDGDVLYGAFTGKASLVLRNKGCEGASTIHSMIYEVETGKGGIPTFRLDMHSPVDTAALVIIDEVSMVGPELATDLLSFGTRVLVLGDPAQLPPVSGAGYFMGENPDIMLTEIHRQAADNPIIAMSMLVREGKRLTIGNYGQCRVISRANLTRGDVMKPDQVLVGTNRKRHDFNRKMRGLLKHDPNTFVSGDRVVCLRNDREHGLFNGGIFEVSGKVEDSRDNEDCWRFIVKSLDIDGLFASVQVRREFLKGLEGDLTFDQLRGTQQFAPGYALTVHKSQGSQWTNVLVIDESDVFRSDARRHLYTAITRAAETLTVAV